MLRWIMAVALACSVTLAPALELGEADDERVTISPKLKQALEKAADYLARSQNRDGSWSSDHGKNVGEVSLALMGFMAIGNLPGEGPHGPTVAKGVDWILEQAKPSGLIQFTEQSHQAAPMYGHALSTLMLSEVWGQSRHRSGEKDVGTVLRRAADMIVRVQGPDGGWGYNAQPEDGDTSVIVMQILALKSAQEAGIHVPQAAIDKAIALVKTRYGKKSRIYGYRRASQGYQRNHVGSHAAGTTIMYVTGETDPTYTTEALGRVLELVDDMDEKRYGHKYYFSYYASVASYFGGEASFARCMAKIEPFLLRSQNRNGSWGKPHQTGFAMLAGALPYRYLPVYQR